MLKNLIKLAAVAFILGAIYVYCSGALQFATGGKIGNKGFEFQVQFKMAPLPSNLVRSKILEAQNARM